MQNLTVTSSMPLLDKINANLTVTSSMPLLNKINAKFDSYYINATTK